MRERQLYIVDSAMCSRRTAGSGYESEHRVELIARDQTESRVFVDCYKAKHFVLEP